MEIWYDGNDHTLWVRLWREGDLPGEKIPQPDATVTLVVKRADGTDAIPVEQVQPVATEPGLFKLSLDKSQQLELGKTYLATVTAVDPEGRDGRWEGEIRVRRRSFGAVK